MHMKTPIHEKAMTLYRDHVERDKKGKQISTEVMKRLPEHRTWIKSSK